LRIVPKEEAIAWHLEHKSVPPEQEELLANWATMHDSWELGEADYVDPAMEKILGRPAKRLEDVADQVFSADNKLDTKDLNEAKV